MLIDLHGAKFFVFAGHDAQGTTTGRRKSRTLAHILADRILAHPSTLDALIKMLLLSCSCRVGETGGGVTE